jgi:hypothetical protein
MNDITNRLARGSILVLIVIQAICIRYGIMRGLQGRVGYAIAIVTINCIAMTLNVLTYYSLCGKSHLMRAVTNLCMFFALMQFISWFPRWRGFRYLRTRPNNKPLAFHLIYKWSVFIGFFEIRKFMNLGEMTEALRVYKSHKENERLTDEQ